MNMLALHGLWMLELEHSFESEFKSNINEKRMEEEVNGGEMEEEMQECDWRKSWMEEQREEQKASGTAHHARAFRGSLNKGGWL